MIIEKLSANLNPTDLLHKIGVDGAGVKILASKMKLHFFHLKNMHVGAANILKQDALSIGADLAVPKGVIVAQNLHVNAVLIATTKQLEILSKKELAQPFGLKDFAKELKNYLKSKKTSTKIMGVVNANEDSFYINSRFSGASAIEKIKNMITDGADIIDIGGVSSRPGSKAISEDEEFLRVEDIIKTIGVEKLYEEVVFSIDSYSPKVVQYALENGFSIVNDITGFTNDKLCEITAQYKAKAVIMHMQGSPEVMQNSPHYIDVIAEVSNFFEKQVEKVKKFGIDDIVLDIGIGFGKNLEDNLKLIAQLEHFKRFNLPLLVGASRKSLISQIDSSQFSSLIENRLAGTLALHQKSIENGASIIRVHDVKEHRQMLKSLEAIEAISI